MSVNPHICLSDSSSVLSQKVGLFPSRFIKQKKSQRIQITSGYGQKLSITLRVSSKELHMRYKPELHKAEGGTELVLVMCSFC